MVRGARSVHVEYYCRTADATHTMQQDHIDGSLEERSQCDTMKSEMTQQINTLEDETTKVKMDYKANMDKPT